MKRFISKLLDNLKQACWLIAIIALVLCGFNAFFFIVAFIFKFYGGAIAFVVGIVLFIVGICVVNALEDV